MSSEAHESSRTVELLAWLELNKVRLAVAAGVVVVVVALLAFVRWRRGEVEMQAESALLQAQLKVAPNQARPRPDPAALLRIASDFPDTGAGARALLMGAALLFEDAQYANSRAQFETFLARHGDHDLAGSAAYGVAACLDAEGKTNEAVTAYQGVVARYGSSATANQARLTLASLHEARQEYAQASRLYAEAAGQAAQSLWGVQAAQRREELLRRHPELAPTNAPAATSAPASLSLDSTNPQAAPAPGS